MKAPVAILLSLAAACTSSGRVESGANPEPLPDIDSVSIALASAGDSIALGDAIASRCQRSKEVSACIEQPLSAAAGAGNVKVAMGALNRLGAANPGIRRTGHVYAHAIGIAAGNSRRNIAQTFTQCSESYQSGCYHGIIQAWFASLDSVSASEANALCDPFRKSESDRWIRFQCVHGMGHGLTMLYDHDLPKGLAGCDLLTEWWDRHSCYSGAFMENIVNVTTPHHPASALSHNGGKSVDVKGMDGADHDMAGMDHDMTRMDHEISRPGRRGESRFKPVDPNDPQYPCSVLDKRYMGACYEMQTSVMLYNNKGDIAAAAKACDGAPLEMRPVCYASLGRDISSYSLQNHAEAVRMCTLGTSKYRPWCYYGLVKNFIDLEARPEDGMAMCRDVPENPGKTLCYNAVGEQIMILQPDIEKRRALCAGAESEFAEACRYGARLVFQAPESLVTLWQSARQQ